MCAEVHCISSSCVVQCRFWSEESDRKKDLYLYIFYRKHWSDSSLYIYICIYIAVGGWRNDCCLLPNIVTAKNTVFCCCNFVQGVLNFSPFCFSRVMFIGAFSLGVLDRARQFKYNYFRLYFWKWITFRCIRRLEMKVIYFWYFFMMVVWICD